MLTSKERSILRGMANTIEPIFQIGKGGLNENLFEALSGALEARELIKVRLLETAMMSPKSAANEIAQAIGCDVVQVIGSKIVLYRESKENKKIVF